MLCCEFFVWRDPLLSRVAPLSCVAPLCCVARLSCVALLAFVDCVLVRVGPTGASYNGKPPREPVLEGSFSAIGGSSFSDSSRWSATSPSFPFLFPKPQPYPHAPLPGFFVPVIVLLRTSRGPFLLISQFGASMFWRALP